MAKCQICGAPVNLAPDGDPKYEPPNSYKARAELLERTLRRIRNKLHACNRPALREGLRLELRDECDQALNS